MGFTRFTLLDEKPPEGCTWSGVRLTEKQTTSRPDYLWPEIWKDMSEAGQRKEKHKWAVEKPNLDNARKLRGICFTDPTDAEFKKTFKNSRKKLEVPMPASMPCRNQKKQALETCSSSGTRKTKYACIVEADESTTKRLEGTTHKDHEDHIAGKGINSLNHDKLVRKFVPAPQAMKIVEVKSAVEKEWQKPEKTPAWQIKK